MNSNNLTILTDFLKRNGITDSAKIANIVSGFDLTKAVYPQMIEPTDRLFQFLRNEESGRPEPQTGNWFCLIGATMDALAIFGGGAGRRLQEFRVKIPVLAIEGTAKHMRQDWRWAGGGSGGATQIYLPPQALYLLEGVGTHLP